MQNELDIVRDISARLDSAGIGYMLTGSMAMNYYAQPRMTRDIGLVAALGPGDTDRVVCMFTPDYYMSKLFWAKDADSELQLRDVRNLIETGCNRAYIGQWTATLGLSNLWAEISHD